jgi:hypothetical protein
MFSVLAISFWAKIVIESIQLQTIGEDLKLYFFDIFHLRIVISVQDSYCYCDTSKQTSPGTTVEHVLRDKLGTAFMRHALTSAK